MIPFSCGCCCVGADSYCIHAPNVSSAHGCAVSRAQLGAEAAHKLRSLRAGVLPLCAGVASSPKLGEQPPKLWQGSVIQKLGKSHIVLPVVGGIKQVWGVSQYKHDTKVTQHV